MMKFWQSSRLPAERSLSLRRCIEERRNKPHARDLKDTRRDTKRRDSSLARAREFRPLAYLSPISLRLGLKISGLNRTELQGSFTLKLVSIPSSNDTNFMYSLQVITALGILKSGPKINKGEMTKERKMVAVPDVKETKWLVNQGHLSVPVVKISTICVMSSFACNCNKKFS